MPLGAMIAKTKIMNWEAGSHASTFGGNPLSCQAAMATIELLENNMMKNAEKQGKRLLNGLVELQKSFECMGDVRGKGLMVAVELVKNRKTKEPATDMRPRIIKRAFEKGLLLLGCGENSVRFCPALTIKPGEVDTCLSIFEEALKEVAG
jgi:4-aminobutyrate aminotransferase